MYINKIDDLIDKIIDDFYLNIVTKDSLLSKLLKEANFVKFQKEINELLVKYTQSIDLSDIRQLVKSNDAVKTISETLNRYIAFYLFLTIGFYYSGKEDTYINNVIEFTKNQSEFNFKIYNFFNSESNSTLIKYNAMIHNVLNLLSADQSKIDILKTKPNYKESIMFLNQLGSDFIMKNFMTSGKNSKSEQCHKIIKTLIILLLYKANEKKDFFRLLELTENLDGDYMFIDIVVPNRQHVDFNLIEQIVGSAPNTRNLAYDFWDFITKTEETLQIPQMSIDDKLIELVESGIVHPISDDFLLYHKDSEKYDKVIDPTKIKKKEDTKIRYIVNKIDMTSEYYSDQVKRDDKSKTLIKKNFYVPLSNRKAITINDNEDISIINKFINQGKRSVENNEYFNDLINYKIYPYVNFKDFENSGFSLTFRKTINIVRQVSLSREGEFKQNSHDRLQMRVGSKDMTVNIIGLFIPSNLRPIQCLRTRDTKNIKDITGKTNGYELMLKYLQESKLGSSKHKSSLYWLFNLEDDISTNNKGYEQSVKYSSSDQTKILISSLYESLLDELYNMIIEKLKNTKDLTIQDAYGIIDMYETRFMKIPVESDLFTQLENDIFSLVNRSIGGYDTKEDIVYGVSSDSIKLPSYPGPVKPNVHTIKVDLSNINEHGIIEEKEMVDGICQHNVSWDKISSIRKTQPKRYTEELYSFIQQYVMENIEQEFVCKSCGYQLNIKKYIIDGVFDDDTQKFVTYSMPMEVPLEDIPEYEKYKPSIRNIDKLIEKIASITNLPHLKSSVNANKWRRKAITKDLIDLLLINNAKITPIYKERNEVAAKKYGINRNISNFFVFELDNSIFIFSSKDKDVYREPKQNNIVAYMTYLIMLDINESHIMHIGNDKKGMCNITVFNKIYHHLFDGLKIIINSKGDIANITDYKMLCYIIYIMGCFSIKYNMWFFEGNAAIIKKKPELLINIQKMFVHTLIDVMNSVLEQSLTSDSHIYEIVSVKTFKKLLGTFSDDGLYAKLVKEGRTSIANEKKDFIIMKKKLMALSGKFIPMEFDPPSWRICKLSRMYLNKKNKDLGKYYNISNITNCKTGQFHNWKPKKGHFVCTKCDKSMNNIKHDSAESKEAQNNFKYVRLGFLSNTLCIDDGHLHQFAQKNSKEICIKCENDNAHKYTHNELDKLEKILEHAKTKESEKLLEESHSISKHNKKEVSYITKIVEKITMAYNESSDNSKMGFINSLLNELHSVIGNETVVDNLTVNLRDNSYIVNHDHLGYPLNKEYVLTSKQNKISYKKNHSFFESDVIYYTSYKSGKVEVFYDATSRILLGYKEESKNYVLNKKKDRRLIIEYSVMDKLKMIGHKSQFTNLEPYFKKNIAGREKIESFNKEEMVKYVISELVRNRVANLKKIIAEFQKIMYKILNNSELTKDDIPDTFSSKMVLFIEKQKKKISNINIFDKNGMHMIFKHWKGVTRGIYAEKITSINDDHNEIKTMSADDINRLDKNGNMILYYIISELTKLLKYNSRNHSKIAIAEFVVEYINMMFELFNDEKIVSNLDMKRFNYVLNSATYMREINDNNESNETEGIYNEHYEQDKEISQEEQEQITDLQEEQDAIDIEGEYDYESGYDKGQTRAFDEYVM